MHFSFFFFFLLLVKNDESSTAEFCNPTIALPLQISCQFQVQNNFSTKFKIASRHEH